MNRPTACPNCNISWEGYEPAEAMVKPTRAEQFEIEYYAETDAGNWQCLRCSHVVSNP